MMEEHNTNRAILEGAFPEPSIGTYFCGNES